MLPFLSKPGTTAVLLVASCAVSGLLLWYQNTQLTSAQQELGKMAKALETVNNSLNSLGATARMNQNAQAKLLEQLQQVTASNGDFNQQLQGIKNDVQAVKMWAETKLPVDVSRLHQRPQINSTDEYRAWLSLRYSVPTPPKQSNSK